MGKALGKHGTFTVIPVQSSGHLVVSCLYSTSSLCVQQRLAALSLPCDRFELRPLELHTEVLLPKRHWCSG